MVEKANIVDLRSNGNTRVNYKYFNSVSKLGLHDISCRDDNRDMRMRDIHIAGTYDFIKKIY